MLLHRLSAFEASMGYKFDSFGKQTAATGPLMNPFQYTAREFDPETSLYYYRARYYDPTVGRFISEDAARFGAGENFYGYVNNSPATFADPLGLAPCNAAQTAECTAACGGKGMTLGSCTHIDVYFIEFNLCRCKGPCGDCSPLQHALLQGAVNWACKSGRPSACTASQTCAELKANLAINAACATARNRINNTCYGGGDAGHKEAAANATAAAAKCASFMAAKGCK